MCGTQTSALTSLMGSQVPVAWLAPPSPWPTPTPQRFPLRTTLLLPLRMWKAHSVKGQQVGGDMQATKSQGSAF